MGRLAQAHGWWLTGVSHRQGKRSAGVAGTPSIAGRPTVRTAERTNATASPGTDGRRDRRVVARTSRGAAPVTAGVGATGTHRTMRATRRAVRASSRAERVVGGATNRGASPRVATVGTPARTSYATAVDRGASEPTATRGVDRSVIDPTAVTAVVRNAVAVSGVVPVTIAAASGSAVGPNVPVGTRSPAVAAVAERRRAVVADGCPTTTRSSVRPAARSSTRVPRSVRSVVTGGSRPRPGPRGGTVRASQAVDGRPSGRGRVPDRVPPVVREVPMSRRPSRRPEPRRRRPWSRQ